MPSNLVVSDYELTEAGFKLVRLFQELKEDPDKDLTPFFKEIDDLVGAMRRMGDQVDDSASKIGILEKQLDEAQKRHEALQVALQLAREDRDESLNDMEMNWETEVLQLRGKIEEILREKNGMSTKLMESQQDLQELRRDKEKLEAYLNKAVSEKEDAVSLLREKMSSEEENSDYSDDLDEMGVQDDTEPEIGKNNAEKSANLVSVSLQTEEDAISLDETLKELEMVKDELRNRLMNHSPESDISQNSAVSLLEELAEVHAVTPDETKQTLGNLWTYSQSTDGEGDGPNLRDFENADDTDLSSESGDAFFEEIFVEKMDQDEPDWHPQKSRKFWLMQILFWLGLYLLIDILCFHAFGVHVFSFNRFTRSRRAAVF